MRCMGCGTEMVLTAVVPDETLVVSGFEHQTFRCVGCDATEERLTFTSNTARPTKLINPVPVAPAPQTDETIAKANSSDAPARAWIRAVEKLRNFQAEIHSRPGIAKKTDCSIEFNQTSEQVSAASGETPQSRHSSHARSRDIYVMPARTLRKPARSFSRNGKPELNIELNTEIMQDFNQFWDSLRKGAPLKRTSDSPSPLAAPSLAPMSLPKLPNEPAAEAPASAAARPTPKQVLRHLARYIHRVVISNSR